MIIKKFVSILFVITLVFGAWGFTPPSATWAAGNGAGSDLVKFQLLNRSGSQVVLQLKGPKNYTFTINPGEKQAVQVIKGNYVYSYQACGTTKTGKISIPKVKKFNTINCTVVKIVIENNTGAPFTLKLSGPAEYFFTIEPGVSTIRVLKGRYYFYAHSAHCPGYANGYYELTKGVRWPWRCAISIY